MSDELYDIYFAGNLLDGSDPSSVKLHLQTQFKLSESALERLFSGQRVAIKRGVNRETATRYRERFSQAGALVQIVACDPPDLALEPDTATPPQPAPQPTRRTASLQLAPPGTPVDEMSQPVAQEPPNIDHLRLVTDDNWTLEDCAPPPLPQPLPDIDSLELEPIPPRPPRQDKEFD